MNVLTASGILFLSTFLNGAIGDLLRRLCEKGQLGPEKLGDNKPLECSLSPFV